MSWNRHGSHDPAQLEIEVVDQKGRAIAVAFDVRYDTVQIRRAMGTKGIWREIGIVDRDYLKMWLTNPVTH